MTTYKELLTNNQTITASGLASLANGSYFQLASVDNTTNQDFDAGVLFKLKTGASGVTSAGYAGVYAYASPDGGTTWTDVATGSAGSYSPPTPTNLILIGIVSATSNATTYIGGPFSVSKAFGYLPGKWGLVIFNNTGGAFDSTGGNFSVIYERLQGTSA
jgi:hypothetical protein